MGMTQALARAAAGYAHALLVEVPGHWPIRVAAERAVRARGWQLAQSPADADVLVVCGPPGPSLGEAVELVWQQMPGPRVRVAVQPEEEIEPRLEEARIELLDVEHQRHDAQSRPRGPELPGGEAMGHETGDQDDAAGAGLDHASMGHGEGGGHDQMDHGDDHGDMEMSPGGIPLAQGGEDRDGLDLDVLHVPLGPVLAHWPAGLRLRCGLQVT